MTQNNPLDITKHFPKDYFSKWLLRFGVLSLIGMVVLIALVYGIDTQPYMYCNERGTPVCVNPYYYCFNANTSTIEYQLSGCEDVVNIDLPNSFKTTQYLKMGEYIGTPPPQIIKRFPIFAILYMIAFLGINHLKWRHKNAHDTNKNRKGKKGF